MSNTHYLSFGYEFYKALAQAFVVSSGRCTSSHQNSRKEEIELTLFSKILLTTHFPKNIKGQNFNAIPTVLCPQKELHANGFFLEQQRAFGAEYDGQHSHRNLHSHIIQLKSFLPTEMTFVIRESTLGKKSLCQEPLINNKPGKNSELKGDSEAPDTLNYIFSGSKEAHLGFKVSARGILL